MSLLRYMRIFGSSTGNIIEPTTDGRVKSTVYGSTGTIMEPTSDGRIRTSIYGTTGTVVEPSSDGRVKTIPYSSTGGELFTDSHPATIDFHSPHLDAFGRVRISEAQVIFDSAIQYSANNTFTWNQSLTGSGTATHLPNESSLALSLSTASGDKVIRQSKRYVRYQPGKSQFVAISGVMGAKKTNVRQRIGLFDDQNGLFFEQDSSNLKIVRRTFTSGSVVDTAVNQSSWNLDKLDGTGTSGITLDMSKTQIFVIDFQWLGVGRVRFGFDIAGVLYYCHELDNANSLTEVYMSTANLPVRYEIENTAEAASSTTMKQICTSVASEAGFTDERGITFGVGTGSTQITLSGTQQPILTVKPKLNFGTTTLTNRGEIVPEEFQIAASNNGVYYELIYNGTLNSTTYVDPSTNCAFEYQTSSTTITGGEVIWAGIIVADTKVSTVISESLKNKLTITNSIAGTSSDRFTIACTAIGTSTAALISAAMTVKQLA